jgi:hypothetical protein
MSKQTLTIFSRDSITKIAEISWSDGSVEVTSADPLLPRLKSWATRGLVEVSLQHHLISLTA